MEAVAEELRHASGKQDEKFTADTLRPRLHSLMTPWMGEGFFADVVVLVEGEDDRAAILGYARSKKCDLDSLGITVIPCFGKNNLDRPLAIFRHLGISVYVIWDGDWGKEDGKQTNRKLLRLLNEPEQDWPSFVGDSGACFKVKLEDTLQDEIGREDFGTWLSEAQHQLGFLEKKHALKNPATIDCIIAKAALHDKTSRSLEDITENIVALKTQS